MKCLLTLIAALSLNTIKASDTVYSFRFRADVTITIDRPLMPGKKKTQIIIYALPNGNTTAETMGKKIKEGDDWHYDIQHIKAQTQFIRYTDTTTNYIVVYLENDMKAWPAWTNKYAGQHLSSKIIDTIKSVLSIKKAAIHLNSHSGGGAFIFDLLKQGKRISNNIERITFIDSDYRYDSTYTKSLKQFLKQNPNNQLTVFAYNDSIALLNGKPFVSATGGTWYRTKLMIQHLQAYFDFAVANNGNLTSYSSTNHGSVNILLHQNPERKILHTKQVELNGFIHSVFVNTAFENSGYKYWGERVYEKYIR